MRLLTFISIFYITLVSSLFFITPVSVRTDPEVNKINYKIDRSDLVRIRLDKKSERVLAVKTQKINPDIKKPVISPSPTASVLPEMKTVETSAADSLTIQTKVVPTLESKKETQAGTVQDYILGEINNYRAENGLSQVSADSYTCELAKTRASEIVNNFNHDGFQNRMKSNSLPYPSFSRATENIAMNPDYKNVVSSWIASAGHAENMRKDTPFVCVAQSGNYYVYEGWRP